MIRKFATALTLACLSTGVLADDYPSRAITLVMPYAAGGPGDTLARIVAQGMSKSLGKPIVIENIAGAGGTIGSAQVAGAKPDGYTLLINHISHATNPTLYRKLRYDTLKDFEPIGLVADLPMAFVAKKSFPAKEFAELIQYVKVNKEKVTYGHAGIGSASHLCGLMFFSAIQTQVTTVPYKGSGPAMNDLLGGQIDFMCDQTINVISPIKSGAVKPYAVTSPQRTASLPDLPTADEAGLKSFQLNIWYGMFAPAGTPKPVIDKIVAALNASLRDPDVVSKLEGLGAIPAAPERVNPGPLQAHVKAEIDRWAPVIKAAGVYAE